MGETKQLPSWIEQIQDARIELRNRLIDFEGQAYALAERAEKLESTNAALLAALEGLLRDIDESPSLTVAWAGAALPRRERLESARAALAAARGGKSSTLRWNPDDLLIRDEGGTVIADLWDRSLPYGPMFAAAPKLLAALVEYVDADDVEQGHNGGIGGEVQARARAAVALAKGEG